MGNIKKLLTIAGSDTSGGAGIQADLKTFQQHEVYGMSALTVIVAQDPVTWDHASFPIDISILEAQLDTVLGGIGVDGAKTGMLPSHESIVLVAEKVRKYKLPNLVIDPVMVCKGTDEVVNPMAVDSMRELLLPYATVVTPNVFEASQLSGIKNLNTIEDLKKAAEAIYKMGAKNVFITGGTRLDPNKALDLFYDGETHYILELPIVDSTFNHGAGCTTSAAVAVYLAKGLTPLEAVEKAKAYVTKAIAQGIRLNKFVGAVKHWAK